MSEVNKSQHILTLAEEIINDIEYNRISAEALVLKANRLGNLAGSAKIQKWLSYEKYGYNSTDLVSVEYLNNTYRIVKSPANTYYGSLASQEMAVESYKIRLEQLKHNPEPPKSVPGFPHIQAIRLDKTIVDLLNQHQLIINKVKALIHNFASTVYYERLFSDITENIFGDFKTEVDKLLAQSCGSVLAKVPSIYKRLNEGDLEAVSQALTSCRRIIDSFADAIYPPTNTPINMDGNVVNLTSQHHQNRINAYIRERVKSDSRRTKLRQSLKNLYERASAGIHSDVTLAEARSLFLETYLLLGEIITL